MDEMLLGRITIHATKALDIPAGELPGFIRKTEILIAKKYNEMHKAFSAGDAKEAARHAQGLAEELENAGLPDIAKFAAHIARQAEGGELEPLLPMAEHLKSQVRLIIGK